LTNVDTVREDHPSTAANLPGGWGWPKYILGVVRSGRSESAPYAVGGYIAAAYWFTSSTSFANPAVTIARTLSDTFAGIEPSSVPPFIVAQFGGGLIALALARFLFPDISATNVVVPTERIHT
jgi:glycerol uptake facilitator-like aquaporin